jgi:phosphonate transport system substrate-binding protein
MISPRETLEVYGEIVDYIGQKLGRPTQLIQRRTYAEVNHLLETGEVDLAFVCTRPYVEGQRDFGMELLVAPKVQGDTVYYSYIIVPLDSPVGSLAQLRGKSFAFVDPMSNTGKLVPTYMLAKMGETPESFFSNYVFTYSHSNSIKWVARHLVDGAAVDSLVWDYAAATDPTFTSKTKIIDKSPPYGIPPVVVSPRIDPELKERLREIFLSMDEDERGREIIHKIMIEEFVIIDDKAYESVREMLQFVENFNLGNHK